MKRRIFFILIPLLFLLYVITFLLIVYSYQHKPGENLFDVSFCYGPLIKNLIVNNSYSADNLAGYRMPFIPYFLSTIGRIYNNLPFAYLVKNILFFTMLYIVFFLMRKKITNINRRMLFFIIIYALSFPQLVLHAFSVEYEEPYLIVFISILFAYILAAKKIKNILVFLFPAAINALVFLTKSSMLPFAIAVSIFYYWRTRSRKVFLVFASMLLAAVLAWGFFNLHNSGRFAISCSLNGYNFYKGNNELTLKFYPKYSLDALPSDILTVPNYKNMTEWEVDRYYTMKGLRFIKDHPLDAFRIFLARFYVLFVRIEGTVDIDEKPLYGLRLLGMLYMLVFRIIFLVCLVISLKNIFGKKGKALLGGAENAVVSFIYLGFIAVYSCFYLAGFAYERYVMVIVALTLLYLAWILDDRAHIKETRV